MYSLYHAFLLLDFTVFTSSVTCRRLGYSSEETVAWPSDIRSHHDTIVKTVQDYIDRGIKKQGRRYKNVTKEGKALFSFLGKTKNATVSDLMNTFGIGRDLTEAWRLDTDVDMDG